MTVLITGSSRGIGRAIALTFCRQGHQIVLNGLHNGGALEDTLRECLAIQPSVMAVPADVSRHEEAKRLFEEAYSRFGGIDVLVNNAGIAHMGLFGDMKPGDWERIMAVNTYSVFNCCHLAIPHMLKRKNGVIINISSIWGVSGASCEAVYSASKGAVNTFTKALGKELAPSGIRVNGIACGMIDTDMNGGLSPEEKKAFVDDIPAMRMGAPEEIARLCLFLAGDGASYMTGQTLIVDGGFL